MSLTLPPLLVAQGGVVSAKLRTPVLPPDALERRRLVQRLRRTPEPVVVVAADAGCGKSTLARQWLAADVRPGAWVTIDPGDDDPIVLLRHLVRALHLVEPLDEVERMLVPGREEGVDPTLARLVAALRAGRSPFVLVLDDVHGLTEPAALHVVETLASAMPRGSHLVVLARRPPALALDPEHTTALGRNDLRFTEEESLAVLAARVPELDPVSARRLVRIIEGWPAGLHLAVLALRGRGAEAVEPLALAGGDERTAAYFHEELLSHLDEATRAFLVRTSVLHQLTPEACDEVLAATGSGEVLDRLVASGNEFVIPLDPARAVYRYHHLFADLLLGELRRTWPAEEPELRGRASRWCAARGHAEAAVAQALASGDRELAARTVHDQLPAVLTRGEVATIDRWLAAFSFDEVHRYPWLALAVGWRALAAGNGKEMARFAEVATRAAAGAPAAATNGPSELTVAIAALRMMPAPGGLRQTADDARLVRTAGRGLPWWGLALLAEADALAALGELDDPIGAYAAAVDALRLLPAGYSVALAHLAVETARSGAVNEAWQQIQDAAREIAMRPRDATTVNVHTSLALLAAAQGLASTSREAAAVAEPVLAAGQELQRSVAFGRLCLAEAAGYRAEPHEAARNLRVVRSFLAAHPEALGFQRWADRLQVQLRRSGAVPSPDLTHAERRVLAELPSHRSLEEIGERLTISRNTVKTHTISIYRKLGVARRAEAVTRARALGLLDIANAS